MAPFFLKNQETIKNTLNANFSILNTIYFFHAKKFKNKEVFVVSWFLGFFLYIFS